ncbi:sigma 54-interacting transcriptional regulator [Chitinophaga flava]|uniref:Sigma-54-dependent Fis family transcriptional regulator n=1 Tax=Chitinophaga flava TaxID=2259036 RepID=A0A365XXS4_9BACT|nr:sigma 54-interacting transcriptional regulator [Chitinophaga flava]RBL91166.1 sigma-54-dependent Fis family transcriptional regulator [Chitinophaga flava]
MEKTIVCMIDVGEEGSPLFAAIQQKLGDEGVVFVRQPEGAGIAIVVWADKLAVETVMDYLQPLVLLDIKIVLLTVNKLLTDVVKWQLKQAGVHEVLEWNKGEEVLLHLTARLKRWAQVEALLSLDLVRNNLIGESYTWKRFLRKVIETAFFTSNSVLLIGESGTGKEMTARLIHELDQRKEKGNLVLMDCTTIVPELSGSEFYGHEKGAFTNAVYARDGAFAMADSGTLFLDELGELALPLQAGLLRVIQEGMYKRVGSNTWRKTNFRLVCATNRNVKEEIVQGNFREDLYFRVAASVFIIPPLRNRREDIPELVRTFLRQELNTIVAPEMDGAIMNFLVHRDYPGNIRELKQLVSQIVMRYAGQGFITMGDMPEEECPSPQQLQGFTASSHNGLHQSIRLAIASGKDLSRIKNEIAHLAMEIALEDCGGNLKLAARKLNVEVRTLQYIRKKNSSEVLNDP